MEKEMKDKICQQVEEQIKSILEEGINVENINMLGKLVDIHKDLANEDYWKKKEEYKMRYSERSYGRDEYGARRRDSRGRYMEGNSYGRRGVRGSGRGRYRGDDMMDEMLEHYGNYSDSKEEYGRGNYGAEGEMVEHIENMGECAVEFVQTLMEEADTPEEKKAIKKYAKKIHEATEMM